jgi:hypothetical protein
MNFCVEIMRDDTVQEENDCINRSVHLKVFLLL